MPESGSFDAKTLLPQLLRRVDAGARFVITRHGHPVPELVPFHSLDPVKVRFAIDSLKEFRRTHGLGAPVRRIIEEARGHWRRLSLIVRWPSHGFSRASPPMRPAGHGNRSLKTAQLRRRSGLSRLAGFFLPLSGGTASASTSGRVSARYRVPGALPIEVEPVSAAHACSATPDLARQRDRFIHDATSLDLALRKKLPSATPDRVLARAARRAGIETPANPPA